MNVISSSGKSSDIRKHISCLNLDVVIDHVSRVGGGSETPLKFWRRAITVSDPVFLDKLNKLGQEDPNWHVHPEELISNALFCGNIPNLKWLLDRQDEVWDALGVSLVDRKSQLSSSASYVIRRSLNAGCIVRSLRVVFERYPSLFTDENTPAFLGTVLDSVSKSEDLTLLSIFLDEFRSLPGLNRVNGKVIEDPLPAWWCNVVARSSFEDVVSWDKRINVSKELRNSLCKDFPIPVFSSNRTIYAQSFLHLALLCAPAQTVSSVLLKYPKSHFGEDIKTSLDHRDSFVRILKNLASDHPAGLARLLAGNSYVHELAMSLNKAGPENFLDVCLSSRMSSRAPGVAGNGVFKNPSLSWANLEAWLIKNASHMLHAIPSGNQALYAKSFPEFMSRLRLAALSQELTSNHPSTKSSSFRL